MNQKLFRLSYNMSNIWPNSGLLPNSRKNNLAAFAVRLRPWLYRQTKVSVSHAKSRRVVLRVYTCTAESSHQLKLGYMAMDKLCGNSFIGPILLYRRSWCWRFAKLIHVELTKFLRRIGEFIHIKYIKLSLCIKVHFKLQNYNYL